ncbi:hypothetical protein Elgi_30870 [Paenibacillus elgii]|nr:hypothetical protein Elgi_30870 [Paenibacillus elgii]
MRLNGIKKSCLMTNLEKGQNVITNELRIKLSYVFVKPPLQTPFASHGGGLWIY